MILAKKESLKNILGPRFFNSLIDESNCNWPIADMNSAYNQMPLDE